MDRWRRAMVVCMGSAAVLCTFIAGYACVRILGAGERLLSNEALIRAIGQWWTQNIK